MARSAPLVDDQDHRPTGERLDERLTFERLLVDLSATFINVPVEEIDEQIEFGLQRLGRFLGVDRSSFAEFSEDKPDMVVTHCYVAEGIVPFPQVIVEEQLPWYARQIRQGEPLRFARLPDELPPEAAAEREYCIRYGLKSNLAIPLKAGGSLNCVITFATFHEHRDWPVEMVERLWLIGEIFANSVARKKSEQRTQQLRDQLVRMARITLVGELAAAIAHEINQPLCAIIANAQAGQRILSQDNSDLSEIRETLHDIAADSRRASEVVARIRRMLQKHDAERAPLPLTDAVGEIAALLQGQLARHGVSLSLEAPPDPLLVLGDRIQLQQVLLNLAINAIEAMAHPEIKSRRLTIRLRGDDEAVRVTVRDSGIGIEPEQLDTVFDAFFTTKPTGIGIGLAISRSIVELHGGRIWASAEPAGGTAFHFTLPAAKEARG